MITIVEKDRVHIAVPILYWADLGSALLRKEDITKSENVPIWKISGVSQCIMGGWHSNRVNDIVRYEKKLVGKRISSGSLYKSTLPKIEELINEDPLVKRNPGEKSNTFVIACKNKAYELCNGLVLEVEEYECESFYKDVALSVLEKDKELSVDEKIKKIGEIGGEIYGTALLPMVVMDTKTQQLRIVS